GKASCRGWPAPRARIQAGILMAALQRQSLQRSDIENEGDRSVAENRGSRNALDLAIVGFEALHHDLQLAEQTVDQEAKLLVLVFDDHDESLAGIVDEWLDSHR